MLLYRFVPAVAALSLCFAYVGCNGPSVDSKAILENRSEHLSKNFNLATVPARTQEQLAAYARPATKPWSQAIVKYRAETKEGDKTTPFEMTDTFVNLGNGYVRCERELLENGLASLYVFSLDYLGFLTLRSQSLYPGRIQASLASDLKELDIFDAGLGAPRVGQVYQIEVHNGSPAALAGFWELSLTVKADSMEEASRVSQGLSGKAIHVTVERRQGAATLNKSQKIYLPDYALLLDESFVSPRFTQHSTIVSVEVKP